MADIAQNRKARHEYQIIKEFEAGIQLSGPEVKSVRAGRVDIKQSFIKIEDSEAYLINSHISPYSHTHNIEYDPKRKRKLLLNKKELVYLVKKTNEKGLAIVPMNMYFKKGWAKMKIALAKGKTKGDKRESLKKKAVAREIDREQKLDRGKYK